MTPKIIFNGKEYTRIEDMPPEVRQAYEQAMGLLADKNQNGIPDIMEGMMGGAPSVSQSTLNLTSPGQIIFNGQTYSNPDQLPPEARQKYEQAMKKLGGGLSFNAFASAREAAPFQSVTAFGGSLPNSIGRPVPTAFDSVQGLGPAASVHQLSAGNLLVSLVVFGLLGLTFLVIGTVFVITFFVGGQNDWPIFFPAGIFLILGAIFVAVALVMTLRLFLGPRVAVVYRDGFAYRDWRSVHQIRWNEIETIKSKVSFTRSKYGRTYMNLSYTFWKTGGEKLSFNDSLENAQSFATAVKQGVYARLQPELAQRYDLGQPLTFGPVTISKTDGLQYGSKRLAWNDILEMKTTSAELQITMRNSGLFSGRHNIPLSSIPNAELMLQLMGVGQSLFGLF